MRAPRLGLRPAQRTPRHCPAAARHENRLTRGRGSLAQQVVERDELRHHDRCWQNGSRQLGHWMCICSHRHGHWMVHRWHRHGSRLHYWSQHRPTTWRTKLALLTAVRRSWPAGLALAWSACVPRPAGERSAAPPAQLQRRCSGSRSGVCRAPVAIECTSVRMHDEQCVLRVGIPSE